LTSPPPGAILPRVTDEELDAFLSRRAANPDSKMAQAAIAELIRAMAPKGH
jgi:hypothetical protein